MTLGPALLEVIRQGTVAIAEEMKFDLMRTARSPVLREAGDLSCALTDAEGRTVAVEIKRRGEIDGVEQLTRYLELLNRDPHLAPVRGIFAAQEIKPQARVLATDRGIGCTVLDYDALRGIEDDKLRLF